MRNAPLTAPVGTILRIWRPYRARLIAGGLLSLAALACGYVLMGSAGGRVAGLAVGVTAGYLVIRLAGLGRIILRYGERLFAHDAMFRALAAVRVWFYRKLASGAAAGLGFRHAGDLLTRLVSDIEVLDGLYLRIALPLAGVVLSVPVLVWVGCQVSPGLGCALGVLSLIAAVGLPLIAMRIGRQTAGSVSSAEARLRSGALDLATGLREARAFGAEALLVSRITSAEEALYNAQTAQAGKLAAAGLGVALCGQMALFLVILSISRNVDGGAHFVSGLAALLVTLTAFESFRGLVRGGFLFAQTTHAAGRVVEVADQPLPVSEGVAMPPSNSSDIVFEHVRFAWAADRAPVFADLSLRIRAGERVALIGASGAGKSSLAALLLKVAAPQAGHITMGGMDLAEINTEALRARFGWLSQATHLFDDTIRQNLLLVRPEASDEMLWRALDDAEIGDVVRGLPDGLDSWVGEGGMRLSGGQGRRIALARTLLTEAPFLILDEPANGLDAETEQAFLRTLNRSTKGRGVILIAHHLAGVEALDRVLRLQDGRIESVAI